MAVFSEAHQRRYRYIYCGIPTGGCRRNRNERAANGRPFFDNVAVSTADLITPHPSPKVTPSPQAPQGEDNGLRRETQHRTRVTRNNTVSSATSTPGDRKVQRRTCVTRGSHGFLRNLDTGHRKVQRRTCVTRGSHGFLRTLEPGHRNMRIRSSLNAPLKLLCSGGRGRFRGLRPWSASSSAGTSCLRPP